VTGQNISEGWRCPFHK